MAPAPETSHFLITRFNVLTSYSPGEERFSPRWLNRRYELFRNFCVPSVANQTEKRFCWLVFCDALTPPSFLAKLDNLGVALEPVLVEGEFGAAAVFNEVASRLRAGVRYCTTTRLDSDDCVHKDFIRRIQTHPLSHDFEFINFAHGYSLYRGEFRERRDLHNPFVSLREKVRPLSYPPVQSVFCAAHDRIERFGAVTQIEGPGAWIQNIHAWNVFNLPTRDRAPLVEIGLDDFALERRLLLSPPRLTQLAQNASLLRRRWHLYWHSKARLNHPA